MLRGLLGVFFEIDPFNIDREFLERTSLEDMWEKVVGNRKMATALSPGFFENTDVSFSEIFDNIQPF